MTKQDVINRIHKDMFIGVVRHNTVEETIAHADAFVRAGVMSLEISSAGADPQKCIADLKEKYGDRVMVGAGTVLESVTARLMIMAGADYLAAPSYEPEVNTMCNRHGVFYMPACFTSNEVANAMKDGISIIKLFPGEIYGPNSARAIKNMYRGLDIIAAGGADLNNLEDWFRLGVWAIGLVIPTPDMEEVTCESVKYVERLRKWADSH